MIVTLVKTDVGPLSHVDDEFKIKAEFQEQDDFMCYAFHPRQLLLAGAIAPHAHVKEDGLTYVYPQFVVEH